MSETETTPDRRYFRLRFGGEGDLVVRDDTGQGPEYWGSSGRRRFPMVAALEGVQPSKHNRAHDGLQVVPLGPSYLSLAWMDRTPLPVTELDAGGVLATTAERVSEERATKERARGAGLVVS